MIFFLTLEWLVRKFKRQELPREALAIAPVNRYPVRLPDGIFFTQSHTWLNLFPSGKLRLGIDDFIERLLEHPNLTFLKSQGDAITRGEPIIALTSKGRTLFVHAPIEGKILEVNEQLSDHPELAEKNFFGDGWTYTIKPNSLSQLKDLLLGDETRSWIRDEFRRLNDFLAHATTIGGAEPLLLQDGGLPVPGVMKQMDANTWKEFEQKFLQVR
jgi:glycine cleavage system H protein